jgi:hypothetical protein
MARRKKGAVRPGHGVVCDICGLNCGKGGPLSRHIEAGHGIKYEDYKKCFYGEDVTRVLADAWDDTGKTSNGNTVIVHVLVRRFVKAPGGKTRPRAARNGLRA